MVLSGEIKIQSSIRDIFIPSVKNYCKKFQYKYSLIKESYYEANYGHFDFLATKNKHIHLKDIFILQHYDYTIYIDNDIYIFPDSNHCQKLKEMYESLI